MNGCHLSAHQKHILKRCSIVRQSVKRLEEKQIRQREEEEKIIFI